MMYYARPETLRKTGRSDSAARTGVEAGGEAEAIARIRDGGASENASPRGFVHAWA